MEIKDIDCKTLHTIEDILNQELLLYKKYSAYKEVFFDSELKNICYNSAKQHKENYNLILFSLNQNNIS